MESLEGGCVIVANGRFPSAELPLRLLKEAKTIIACDGAVKTLYEKGIHPDAIVGDLDSIPAGLRERYADRIHHVEDQEINDLTKSVRFAHTQGYREVLILGATGLREDHTLGNISLLIDYAHLFKRRRNRASRKIRRMSTAVSVSPPLLTNTLSKMRQAWFIRST